MGNWRVCSRLNGESHTQVCDAPLSLYACSGVGEALAGRLLEEESPDSITLCLACRNLSKAQLVKENLLRVHPTAHVDLVHLDTSRPSSAVAAARELKSRYNHVDLMYFNAGVMLVSQLDWGVLCPPSPR